MEINFKKATLDDRDTVVSVISKSDYRFCEQTFCNILCWGGFYGVQIFCDGNVFISGNPDKKRFSMPIGDGKAEAIESLCRMYGDIRITGISGAETALFDKRFEVTPAKAYNDYIYSSESLRELRGKKLAAKRNHINAFLSDGEWYTKHITPADKDELITFNNKWCDNRCEDLNSALGTEMCAVRMGLENFEKLGLMGLKLYKNGKLVAYSYGEPINGDTFCVHVEKADDSVRGAYQMINREFAREFCTDFEYINREDDAGDEGLRHAKLSYRPLELGQKYTAIFKG